MIKYVTALRLGTAETAAILNRFTRNNLKHPTYLAFAELAKATKTIFLRRYLHSEALRREIQEGLNVIETWNGANSFMVKLKEKGAVTAKIIDLGLAKPATDAPADPAISLPGAFAGTPEFASPEQFAGVGVDIRSDLYSLA